MKANSLEATVKEPIESRELLSFENQCVSDFEEERQIFRFGNVCMSEKLEKKL